MKVSSLRTAHLTQCLLLPAMFAGSTSAWAQSRTECHRSSFTFDAPTTSAWRAARAAVESALAREDRPWGCSGARVRVVREPDGRPVVEAAMPDGEVLRRHVSDPSELAVTVEGMLVVDDDAPPPSAPVAATEPVPTPAPAVVVVRAPAVDTEGVAAPRAPVATPPSVMLEGFLDVGARTGGEVNYVSLSTRLGASLRAGRWVLSAWGRWEPESVRLDDQRPGRYELGGVAFGVSGAWSTPVGRGLFEVGPSLAVAGYGWHEHRRATRREDSDVQARGGAVARWRSHARGLAVTVTLDADVALGPLFAASSDSPSPAPDAPLWTMGLSVGVLYGGAL